MKQVKVNDNIAIMYGSGKIVYYKVLSMDTFKYVHNSSATSANTTGSFGEVTNLNPPNDQIYIVDGICVDGNVKLYVKQPASINRFGVERAPESTYFTDRESGVVSPFPIEMSIIENYPPSIKIMNHTNKSITLNTIWYGRKLQIQEIGEKPSAYTPFVIGGIKR